MPYKFSFHDILMVLLYMSMGRFLLIEGLFYFYDLGGWETHEGTLAKDRTTYVNAGLPIELDRLHWLICGMEGALMLNSRFLVGKGSFDRGRLSDLWFSAMFNRFKHWNREFGWEQTPTNAATKRLKDKWVSHPEINLHELLFDLCDVLEIIDKAGAQRYFDYWSQI